MKVIVSLFVAFTAVAASANTYSVDPSHSSIGFSVRHIVSKVQGKFNDFDGSFDFDAKKPEAFSGSFTAKTASIDTGTPKRDEHLKSGDFFDATRYPEIKFVSKALKKEGKDKYKLTGDLTMHGVTKPATFNLEYTGQAKDPWGNQRAGFTATSKVNRKDYGIVWNKALDNGGMMVGDDVEVTFNAEAIQKPEEKSAVKAAEKGEKKK